MTGFEATKAGDFEYLTDDNELNICRKSKRVKISAAKWEERLELGIWVRFRHQMSPTGDYCFMLAFLLQYTQSICISRLNVSSGYQYPCTMSFSGSWTRLIEEEAFSQDKEFVRPGS